MKDIMIYIQDVDKDQKPIPGTFMEYNYWPEEDFYSRKKTEDVCIEIGVIFSELVEIGRNVKIMRGCRIKRAVNIGCNVVIERGVVIGVGAIIQDNVTIGRGAKIGRGAIVTRDVKAGAIVEPGQYI